MRAFVDRIEGDIAVLLLGDDESVRVDITKKWLSIDVRAGNVLR
ncbi:MAG: DUF3006 family protein [Armatimonadota bacterium]